MYLLPPIPFGILISPTQQSTLKKKKELHTEALNVWFYALQISPDCSWLETLGLVIVTETEPFRPGVPLAIFNSLVVFTGGDLQMLGPRNPDTDVNPEKEPFFGRRPGFSQFPSASLLHVTVCRVHMVVVRELAGRDCQRISIISSVPEPTCCREELARCQQRRGHCWTRPLRCPNASLWGETLLAGSLCASRGISAICCAVSWNRATFRRHNPETLSGQPEKQRLTTLTAAHAHVKISFSFLFLFFFWGHFKRWDSII